MVDEVKELFEFATTHDISVISGGSRAASTEEERYDGPRITEMINGVLVTRPVRKYTDPNQTPKQEEQQKQESEPEITILNDSYEKSKAGSIPRRSNVNEVKELFDFMQYNGRI